MKTILHVLTSFLLVTGSLPAYAGGCDYLNDIAVRGLSFRLSEQELAQWDTGEDTLTIKTRFVDSLLMHPQFINQVVLVMRFQFMKGATYDDVYRQMEQFDVLSLMLPLAMDDKEEKEMYDEDRRRLQLVYVAAEDYLAGKIDLEEIYRRMFDNFIYDIQNMGVENFIFSTFQFALGRKPTESEFRQGRAMYYNTTGYLFFKEGKSREDYLHILTASDNFLEYQVGYWYYYFMLEFPDYHKIHEILGALKSRHETVKIEDIIRYILIEEV